MVWVCKAEISGIDDKVDKGMVTRENQTQGKMGGPDPGICESPEYETDGGAQRKVE